MDSILRPGYVRWDGLKYVLDPDVEIVGPEGPPGPPGVDGKSGLSSVIFRPGVPSAAPAYATWAEVVAAATAIEGTSPSVVTIIFDDFNASCTIPAGTWNFGPLVTFKGSPNGGDSNNTTIFVNDGAVFTNSPISFVDVLLISNSNTPLFSNVPPAFRIDLTNSFLVSNASASMYNITQQLNIFLYNGSALSAGSTFVVSSTAQIVVYFFMGEIDANTLNTTNSIQYLVNSSSDRPSMSQTAGGGIGVAVGTHQGCLDPFGVYSSGPTSARPSLGGLPPGFRFFDTTLNTLVVWDGTAWITLGATTLNGDVQGPVGSNSVFSISGDGNNVDIKCPITTFNDPGQPNFHPQTIQSSFLNATTSFSQGVYNMPVSSGVQVDVIATALHDASGDFASWKISFGAYCNGGGTAVAVGANPSSSGVTPDRATAGASAWLYTLVLAGSNINSQGTAVSGTRWGITYQIIPLLGP
jgi:hypothetical protein